MARNPCHDVVDAKVNHGLSSTRIVVGEEEPLDSEGKCAAATAYVPRHANVTKSLAGARSPLCLESR